MNLDNKNINDIFRCPHPLYADSNVTLAYRTCILRQTATSNYTGIKVPMYDECASCEYGKEIKKHFGAVKSEHKTQNKFTQRNSEKSKRWKRKNGSSAYTSHYDADKNPMRHYE